MLPNTSLFCLIIRIQKWTENVQPSNNYHLCSVALVSMDAESSAHAVWIIYINIFMTVFTDCMQNSSIHWYIHIYIYVYIYIILMCELIVLWYWLFYHGRSITSISNSAHINSQRCITTTSVYRKTNTYGQQWSSKLILWVVAKTQEHISPLECITTHIKLGIVWLVIAIVENTINQWSQSMCT